MDTSKSNVVLKTGKYDEYKYSTLTTQPNKLINANSSNLSLSTSLIGLCTHVHMEKDNIKLNTKNIKEVKEVVYI